MRFLVYTNFNFMSNTFQRNLQKNSQNSGKKKRKVVVQKGKCISSVSHQLYCFSWPKLLCLIPGQCFFISGLCRYWMHVLWIDVFHVKFQGNMDTMQSVLKVGSWGLHWIRRRYWLPVWHMQRGSSSAKVFIIRFLLLERFVY